MKLGCFTNLQDVNIFIVLIDILFIFIWKSTGILYHIFFSEGEHMNME